MTPAQARTLALFRPFYKIAARMAESLCTAEKQRAFSPLDRREAGHRPRCWGAQRTSNYAITGQ